MEYPTNFKSDWFIYSLVFNLIWAQSCNTGSDMAIIQNRKGHTIASLGTFNASSASAGHTQELGKVDFGSCAPIYQNTIGNLTVQIWLRYQPF